MKRIKNIYKDICDINNIIKYEHIININTKNKSKVEKYKEYYTELIYDIKNTLRLNKFISGKFNIFYIWTKIKTNYE